MPENDRELEQNRLYRILPPDLKDDLSDAEKLILKKALNGEFADCSELDGQTYDVEKPDDWPETRNVQAKFLEWLLRNRKAIELVHDKGVRIYGIRIKEELDLECIQISFTLVINYSRIENGVKLLMAETQTIDLSDSLVRGINADGILIKGVLHLDNIISNDKFSLTGAEISSNLQCPGAKFYNRGNDSFSGDRMMVKGSVFLNDMTSIGRFHIVGADIGGELNCNRAKFINIKGNTFLGDAMIIKGSIFLKKVISVGCLRINGSDIAGSLDCTEALFFNKKGDSFSGDGINVNYGLFLYGIESHCEFRLIGAHIIGSIYTSGATFMNKDKTALQFVNAKIDGRLCLDEINKVEGALDLRGAKAGALRDDENSWPDKGKLILDGFEYDAIVEKSPIDAKSRLEWLDLQIRDEKKSEKTEEQDEKKPEKTYEYKFSPQPYEHLARVFRRMGKTADANTVLLKKERLRRKYVVKNWFAKFWGLLLDATIGYGYRVGRALIIVAAFITLGAIIFSNAHSKESLLSLYEKKENTSSPEFNSVFYSIDTFVPFLDLHQEKYWEPYGAFATYYWIHIIMGWVFTTLLAAKFTGLIRRE